MKLRFILLGIVFLFISINAFSQSATSYTVQLCASETIAGAKVAQEKFMELGYSPIAVVKVDYWYKVFFGHFDYYVDAYLYKMDIRKKGLSDCFMVPGYRVNLPETFCEAKTLGPLEKVIKTSADKISELPGYSLDEHPGYKELEQLLNQAPTGDAYRTKLSWYFNNHQQIDAFRGYLLTRKGILALLDKQYDEALNYFFGVVEGRVPARRLDVIKCAKRIAWILHHKGDRPRAWQAYKEIESFTGSGLVRAQCLAERAGIIFELAQGTGKGDFLEVEPFCDYALKNIPEEYAKQRALVMVIKSEYLMTATEWHKALSVCEEIISKYQNNSECRREYAITLCHTGWLNFWLGDRDKAEHYFQRVFQEIPQDVESFAGYNFFAEATIGIAVIEIAKNNKQEAKKMLEDVIAQNPGTKQATNAKEYLEQFY